MPRKKPQYYAVSCGRQIGIYTSWEKTQPQVIGYRKAAFKGYTTLHEALQVMKMSGYANPPVFDHHKVDVTTRACVSDSHLNMSIHATDELPSENTEVKQILVIDHPELDDEYLLSSTHQSFSDTNLLNFQNCDKNIFCKDNQTSILRYDKLEIDLEVTETKKAVFSPSNSSMSNGSNNVQPDYENSPVITPQSSASRSHYSDQTTANKHVENLGDQVPLTGMFLRLEERIMNL